MTLLRRQVKSDRWTILTWCVTVALLTWLVGAMYNVLVDAGAMEDLLRMVESVPSAIRVLFGQGGFSLESTFIAQMEYTSLGSIAFVVFLSTYVPSLLSKEIDQRTSEFLLALPVKRTTVLLSRWVGLAIALFVIAAVQCAAVLLVTGTGISPARYLLAGANMYLLYLDVGTILLLSSVFVDDYPKAAGVSAGIATFLFFYNGVAGEATGLAASLRRALPFSRFDAVTILTKGTVPWTDMAVLAVETMVVLALAVKAFEAKQVTG